MSAVVMKMTVPRTEPMVTRAASHGPRLRRSDGSRTTRDSSAAATEGGVIDSPTEMGDEVRIRLAKSRADFESCVDVQRAVWRLSDLEITSALQMIATTHAGGLGQLAEGAGGRGGGFAHRFPALRGGIPHLRPAV